MNKGEFKVEFRRLCEGFDYKPRSAQMEAFFERLQHCHSQDWHEAVTDLLCAPRFPMNLEIILDTVEKRAEQRRRVAVYVEQRETKQQVERLMGSLSMREALKEKPELMASVERLLKS